MRYCFFCLLFLAACSAAESPTETITIDTLTENTEYIPIENVYFYEITDNKTGKVIELSQTDYLNSSYLNNPGYSIKEVVHAK